MKTKSQKYNENLERMFAPQLERLKNVESIAKEILQKIERLKSNYPDIHDCHLINAIQKILSEKTTLKN